MTHPLRPWTAMIVVAGLALPVWASAASSVQVSPVIHFTNHLGAFPAGANLVPPIVLQHGAEAGHLLGASCKGTAGVVADGAPGWGYIWQLDPASPETSFSATRLVDLGFCNDDAMAGGQTDGSSSYTSLSGLLTEAEDGRLYVGEFAAPVGPMVPYGRLLEIALADDGAVDVSARSSGGSFSAPGQSTVEGGGDFSNPAPGQMAADGEGNLYFFAFNRDSSGTRASGLMLVRLNTADNTFQNIRNFNLFPVLEPQPGGGTLSPAPDYSRGMALIYSAADDALYLAINQWGSAGVYRRTLLGRIDIADVQADGQTPVEVLHTNISADASHGTLSMVSIVEDGGWIYGTRLSAIESGQTTSTADHALWRVRKDGTDFDVVHRFGKDAAGEPWVGDAGTPYGALVRAADGNVYGVSLYGGEDATQTAQSGLGTLYRIVIGADDDRADDAYELLHTFNSDTGYRPTGLALAEPGVLYGTTLLGGDNAVGALFRVDYPLPPVEATLTVSPAQLRVGDGQRVTLTWSSTGTLGALPCEISAEGNPPGDYVLPDNGRVAAAGNYTFEEAPRSAGEVTVTLRCDANDGGAPVEVVRQVTVQDAARRGGGSGGAAGVLLLAIACLGIRLRRRA